jgi:head-tail adaptor
MLKRNVNLDRRLVLEEARSVSDGAGGNSEIWSPLGVHWGQVDARTGSGRAREFLTRSRLGLKITIRYAPQGSTTRPKPGQRFVEGTRIYAIDAVHEMGARGGYLMCFAEEEVTT